MSEAVGNSTGSNAGTSLSSSSQGTNSCQDVSDVSDSSSDSCSFGQPFFSRCRCEYCAEDDDDYGYSVKRSLPSTASGCGSTTLGAHSAGSTASCTITSASAAAASVDVMSAKTSTDSIASTLGGAAASSSTLASSSKPHIPSSSGHHPALYQDDSNMSVDDYEEENDDELSIKWACWDPVEQHKRPVSANSSSESADKALTAVRRKRTMKVVAGNDGHDAAAADDDDDDDDAEAGKSMSKRCRKMTNKVSSSEVSLGMARDVIKCSRQACSSENDTADPWTGNLSSVVSLIKTTL